MKHIEQWLALYPEATDIHLMEGGRVIVREYGGLKELEERAEKSFFDMLFHSCLSPDKRKVYEEKGACDTSFSIGENRFRLHLYRAEKTARRSVCCLCWTVWKKILMKNGLRRLQNYPPALSFFQALQEVGKAPPWQEYWKESARKKRVTS